MGDIVKRGNTFQARVRRGVYRTNALTKTFSSRVDAKKWIRDIEAKLDKTNIIVKEVDNFPTLSSLIKRYLSEVSIKKASYQTDKFNFRTYSECKKCKIKRRKLPMRDELVKEFYCPMCKTDSVEVHTGIMLSLIHI